MKSFLHFRDAAAVTELLNNIFLSDAKNSLSFTQLGSFHELHLDIVQTPLHSLKTSFHSLVCPDPTFFQFELDTTPAASALVSRSFIDGHASLTLSGSTPGHKTSEVRSPFKSGCAIAANAVYRSDAFDASLFLSAKHDPAFSLLTSIKLPALSASLGGVVTRTSNVLEGTILTASGLCAAVKADLSIPRLFDLKIGWIFRFTAMIGYASANFPKSQFKVGVVRTIRPDVDIALKAEYSPKKFAIAGAIKVSRRAEFRCTFGQDGRTQLMTNFEPLEWLAVSLRSETSITHHFDPVSFGWSLHFTLPDELPESSAE
jgi:hypothetical protein